MECFEIWFKDSHNTNLKNTRENYIFQNGSPSMASEAMHNSKILISKLNRWIVKQPIRMLINPYMVLKTNSSGLELCMKFYFCSQIWYAIDLLKESLPY